MINDDNTINAKNKTEGNVSSSQNISDSVINKSNVTINHHHHYSEKDESQKEVIKPGKKTKTSALLEKKVREFNSRINDEPTFSKKIEGKNRTICICISDEGNYSTKLDNLKIESFKETNDPTADVVVTASSEVIIALITKKSSPIKAYMSGDLKVKASIMDMLLLKNLF